MAIWSLADSCVIHSDQAQHVQVVFKLNIIFICAVLTLYQNVVQINNPSLFS